MTSIGTGGGTAGAGDGFGEAGAGNTTGVGTAVAAVSGSTVAVGTDDVVGTAGKTIAEGIGFESPIDGSVIGGIII